MLETLEANALAASMRRFDQSPFCLKFGEKEYRIGEGTPEFTVRVNRNIPVKSLMTSTSLALGEAYMDGDIEIEGDLYDALDHFWADGPFFHGSVRTEETDLHLHRKEEPGEGGAKPLRHRK